ncbi:hypothetical protein KK062_24330 [Fulvivirgaceae bacterium PWU5]|uniref:Uncharacterized protein n=1 Tax=Dawidia cretensis TaxID=2782350 RepID=A0AAP2E490_9BACT|nr:hypothetical protein [Dawidia cretensis]MBT1711392.1 hypothetical protein [Dawidia cretensis]
MTLRNLMLTASLLSLVTVGFAQKGTLTKVPEKTVDANPKGYVEYLPPGFDDSGAKKYPVLYWLHGLNDAGMGTSSSLDKILNVQVCQWLKTHNTDFIVLVPQDPSGYWSGNASITNFITWATDHYKAVIEPGQQHLAGLSAGGYAIRDMIVANSDVYKSFSTFTLMSTNLTAAVSKVQQIVDNKQYVWIHQGEDDVMPNLVADVANFHTALYKLDATRTRLTVYRDLGHEAWECVYNAQGMNTAQVTGAINGAPYYQWAKNDPDGDWFEWMKACGKKPLNATAPNVLRLSAMPGVTKSTVGTAVGRIVSNGARPTTFSLPAGISDNAKFSIKGDQLVVGKGLEPGTYTVTIEAKNSAGDFRQEFTIILAEGGVVGIEGGERLGLLVHPNPVQGNTLYITAVQDPLRIDGAEVVSTTGARRTVPITSIPAKNEVIIAFDDIPAGTYILRLLKSGMVVLQHRLVRY